MNKQPVSYLQTDPRWKTKPYRVKGETSTIGGSGCGPTCAAMIIETLTGKKYTPVEACNWSVQHGYKYLNQGTAYGYFIPQFKEFNIDCFMLNWENTYHNPNHPNHDKMLNYLKNGYYVIALMKKGTWTSGGHYVVVWWADNKIRINDPASTKTARTNGDINTFRNEVKHYWIVDARKYNNSNIENNEEKREEDEDMTGEEIYNRLAEYLNSQPVPDWAKKEYAETIDKGITDGTRPMMFTTRLETAIMAKRAVEKK